MLMFSKYSTIGGMVAALIWAVGYALRTFAPLFSPAASFGYFINWIGLPGFLIGNLVSGAFRGNIHAGGEPVGVLIVGTVVNFFLYNFLLRLVEKLYVED